jgi:hypothetical protein
MERSAVIIDDVFSYEELTSIQSQIYEKLYSNTWFDLTEEHEWQSFSHALMKLANQYYDLSDVVGYEFWSHYNTRPYGGWHYDKDEVTYHSKKIYKFPVCSIVYYPIIDNMSGGELILEKDVVVPKVNRVVIFKPGMYHYVNEFDGTRYSMLINPWTYKLPTVSE